VWCRAALASIAATPNEESGQPPIVGRTQECFKLDHLQVDVVFC
jgi:hypothetical protein